MESSGNRHANLRIGAYFLVSLLLALGVLSVLNRAATLHGEDGVLWSRGAEGLRAATVEPDGPGSRAGIREGDFLEAIGRNRVSESAQVRDALWGRGGVPTPYELQRAGTPIQVVVHPRLSGEEGRVFYYLCLVGFLSLGAGALVISRPPWNPKVRTHFLLLASFFSVLVFSPSGRGGILDWSFYWGDVAGRLLLPVLLFQFIFQMGKSSSSSGRPAMVTRGLWIGAGLLFVWNLYLIPFQGALSFADPVAIIGVKDRLELAFLAAGSISAVSLLLFYLFTTSQSRIRWRLRWLAFAAGAGLLPALLLHLLPRALDVESGVVAELSVLPLALMPLGFTAALLQETTVDLDRTLKGVARVTLEAAVLFGVALLFSWAWRGWSLFPTNAGLPMEILLSLAVGAAAACLLHRPLGKSVERLLGGAPPEVTRALSLLQSEINGEVQLENLARNWIARLRQVLRVEQATLYVREGTTGQFHREGDPSPGEAGSRASWTLSSGEMDWLAEQEMVLLLGSEASARLSGSSVEGWVQSGGRYLLPLVVRRRLNAFLLVGAHRDGSPLESKELEIVAAAAAQAGRAVDGARLYGEIEERIVREKRLRAQSQGILDASPVGILLADEGGKVSAANRAAHTILGQKILLGRRLDEILPKGLLWNLDRIGKGRGSTHGQGRASRYSFGAADGQVRIVNATRAPLAGDSGPGQVYTFDDVTGEVEREQKMLQQDHLASVGLLASKVAHEVNTPLTGIASYAQMLMARMRSRLPEMDLLRRIETQAFRAAGIANSVLNMARRKEGEAPRDFEPGAMIAECLNLFEAHLKGKPIRVTTERAALLPRLRGQRGRLEQAVMNLLLNAAEAMPEGGEIQVRLLAEGSQLKIQVSDNGVGIDPKLLPRIFEPFVTSRAGGKGTGLGLAVVREVAKEFGGRIEVESQVGQGTTLTLHLPGKSAYTKPVARGA